MFREISWLLVFLFLSPKIGGESSSSHTWRRRCSCALYYTRGERPRGVGGTEEEEEELKLVDSSHVHCTARAKEGSERDRRRKLCSCHPPGAPPPFPKAGRRLCDWGIGDHGRFALTPFFFEREFFFKKRNLPQNQFCPSILLTILLENENI